MATTEKQVEELDKFVNGLIEDIKKDYGYDIDWIQHILQDYSVVPDVIIEGEKILVPVEEEPPKEKRRKRRK